MTDIIKIRCKYDRLIITVVLGYMDNFFKLLSEYEKEEIQTATITSLRRDLSISSYKFELTLPHNDYAPIIKFLSTKKRVFIYGRK